MKKSNCPGTVLQTQKEAGTKVLASQLFLDCRARRSGRVGSTTLISSAFTALLNCAEVGRRNRILTNYRFLSHSLIVILHPLTRQIRRLPVVLLQIQSLSSVSYQLFVFQEACVSVRRPHHNTWPRRSYEGP